MKTLIIGYGNPGRQDDGLGPALAQYIEDLKLPNISVDIDYQLNIEHAHDLMGYERVIFVDAALKGPEPYDFQPLNAGNPTSFTSHSVSPQAILRLAKDLFQIEIKAFTLAIRGYEFEIIEEELSPKAAENLKEAQSFLLSYLK
ncbi:hydrogenase maturation protease [Terasakiella sp. SH-1]|uniref:hydrogenase maturation protease n=1 Tax=Terasakiella sp. SH-1 TaxID=2560057 RepID=UPI001073A6FF|nr:hydrogenase maturation protease [Terasakiella sp. SH-1]